MSFNSPVWFNVGIEARPQCSACFINSVQDSMSSIMDLAKTEAMLFKFGSGAGSNLSTIRSSREQMSGGGTASGPVSFMKGYDAFAGVVKSGGKTRRAAKMVILDVDHPDVLDFIDSKKLEEQKAWALIEMGYDPSFTGEAYGSVFFQNANHSVRVTDAFMQAVVDDQDWTTHAVVDGKPMGTYKAKDIFRRMADAAHLCGDPGIQYDTTINDWHTSANTDRIYASNPCSEYMFLNDTACFAPETRISTPDGLRTVEELYLAQERGEKVQVTTDLLGESDHRRMATHRGAVVTLVGDRKVYRLTMRDGRSIRATGDHRFLTDNGEWKRVDQLTAEVDRVQVRESGNTVRFKSSAGDVRRWQVLGWMSSDGVFSGDVAALAFGPTEKATAEVLTEELNLLLAEARDGEDTVQDIERGLLGRGPRLADGADGAGTSEDGARPRCRPAAGRTSPSRPAAGCASRPSRAPSSGCSRIATACGPPPRPSARTSRPRSTGSTDDLKVAYLQGLFSADATIRVAGGGAGPEVTLASTAPELVRSVQLLLSDLGIASRIAQASAAEPFGPADASADTRLHVYGEAARRFLSLVGAPLSADKQAKAEAILAHPFARGLDNPRATTVESIVPDGVETVYDVTEPMTHSLVAEGLIAHNCNLASLNLMKFVGEDGEFDVEAYRYAAKLTITAQEILVDNASLSDAADRGELASLPAARAGLRQPRRAADEPRPGLRLRGGSRLRRRPDRDHARRGVSAERRDRPRPRRAVQRLPEERAAVPARHRQASRRRLPSRRTASRPTCSRRARLVFDEALELGREYGYRNAQVTVLAPTGTIAFMMDCDTTGIEPDIALIKYKKLVGEGFLKIVNQTVPAALAQARLRAPSRSRRSSPTSTSARRSRARRTSSREHLSVFDCAFKPVNGERSIHYMGHVRMMARRPAVPLRRDQQDRQHARGRHGRGDRGGLPRGLEARPQGDRDLPRRQQAEPAAEHRQEGSSEGADAGVVAELRAQLATAQAEAKKPHRRRLPAERTAVTHKFDVAGHEGYITVGLYPDGQPGEIFLKMAKEGSTVVRPDGHLRHVGQPRPPVRRAAARPGQQVRPRPVRAGRASPATRRSRSPSRSSTTSSAGSAAVSCPPTRRPQIGLIDRSEVVDAPSPISFGGGFGGGSSPSPAAPIAEEGPSAIDEAVAAAADRSPERDRRGRRSGTHRVGPGSEGRAPGRDERPRRVARQRARERQRQGQRERQRQRPERDRRLPRDDEGRLHRPGGLAELRRMRLDHGPQRQLLQVPQLRLDERLQLTEPRRTSKAGAPTPRPFRFQAVGSPAPRRTLRRCERASRS